MKKSIFLVVGILLSSFSQAAEWAFVGSTSTDADYYIDRTYYNFDKVKNTSEVWFKVNKFKGLEEYKSSVTLTSYHCTNKKEKILSQVNYSSDNKVLNTLEDINATYRAIFPDTIGEDLWIAACKNKGAGLYLPYRPILIHGERVKLLKLVPVDKYQELPEN